PSFGLLGVESLDDGPAPPARPYRVTLVALLPTAEEAARARRDPGELEEDLRENFGTVGGRRAVEATDVAPASADNRDPAGRRGPGMGGQPVRVGPRRPHLATGLLRGDDAADERHAPVLAALHERPVRAIGRGRA